MSSKHSLYLSKAKYSCPDEVRTTSDESSTRLFYWRRTRELLIIVMESRQLAKKAYSCDRNEIRTEVYRSMYYACLLHWK